VVIPGSVVTDFYLPGVTPNVNTAADIPIPVNEGDTDAFLAAVFSGQTNINVRVGELRQWGGPILMIDKTVISAANV
jgi:hypothetical protein